MWVPEPVWSSHKRDKSFALSGFEASTIQPLPNQYMDYDLFCLWPTSVLLLLYYLLISSIVILPLLYKKEVSWGKWPALLYAGYEDELCGES